MKSRIYNNPKNEAKNADRERRRILESFDKQKVKGYKYFGKVAMVMKYYGNSPLSS